MRCLDLFSGIGGFSLGLERAGMETVAFCEYDKKAQLVLKKHWPDVPMFDDVRTLTGEQLERAGITDIGLICGGYPCQPFSVAGKRQGKADDRHLWPEFFRLIQEIRPTWVIAENVAGHINMGLDSVLADLESEGYQCQTFLIPACAVDAFHRRDRVWIVAWNSNGGNVGKEREIQERESTDSCGICTDVAHSESARREARRSNGMGNDDKPRGDEGQSSGCSESDLADTMHKRLQGREETGNPEGGGKERKEFTTGCSERSEPGNWLPEPAVGRVANGVPRRVDRLKQLGNAVVPQIPEVIGRFIMETENGA